MRALDNSAADYAGLLNDIFSYQKEIQFEGELNNGVLVVQNFLNCDVPQAVNVVNDLMTSRLNQFERIVANELPPLFDEYELDDGARRILNGYVEELQNWMSGILEWHRVSLRYPESELLRHLPGRGRRMAGPIGLGTSAARLGGLGELLGAGERS
jgi:germacradienol/geosmin synthase